MAKRGRKSSAELAIVTPLQAVQRPEPPYEQFSDELADEWRAVVNRLPADWFPRETWPLLTQYVRHIIRARRLAQLIHEREHGPESKTIDIGDYTKLLSAEEQQSKAIASL